MLKRLIVGSMQTNCYILYHDHECLVIDPGAQGKKIAQFIDSHELIIKAILITHGHFDHIGAVDYLYQKYQCPIYTHQESFDLIRDSKLNLSYYDQPLTIQAPLLRVYDDMFIAGYHLIWMLLEGHCQGNSMIYVPDEQLIFSGDVLFKGSIGRYDFPTSSHYETKKSLEKINELSFDAKILPGHGDESTLLFEKNNNPFLKS